MLLGVDTGGTFTDFVFYDGGAIRVHKVLSTPHAPEQAILQGIRDLGIALDDLRIIHGSTVATNALLERKGARTVLVTNRGFGDLLSIGRQARRELYDLSPRGRPPPVPAEMCVETGGRLAADGSVVDDLTDADLAALQAAIAVLRPAAVAVNLLFSFVDDRFERRIAAALPADVFVSRSSLVLPEYKEYERGIATWINAWLGPLVHGYLHRLAAAVRPAGVAVMQSSGETIAAELAGDHAVRLLLSGPAGGISGVRSMAALAGEARLMSFDMGGTSTDVALVDGEPRLTSEAEIDGYPIAVPMIDMHTIGAGGGSIAWLDTGGMLQVGPESAGADPGPACYARGGTRPTVTDANLVLGRLREDAFLGGAMHLDRLAAERTVGALAAQLGYPLEQAADGIVRVANEHMARALRVISVARGIDPGGLVLASFGGAGGLHVCALADLLGMTRALVPAHAGVLSALGMLAAPPGRQLSQTWSGLLHAVSADALRDAWDAMRARGLEALAAEGHVLDAVERSAGMDLRYQGQGHTLYVPWRQDLDAVSEAFHEAHRQRYGMRLDVPVELVNLRLALRLPAPPLVFAPTGSAAAHASPAGSARCVGCPRPVPVWRRADLAPGRSIAGPAIVTETVATTWVAPGWSAAADAYSNLHLARGAEKGV